MSETAARVLCVLGMLFAGTVLVLELAWCGGAGARAAHRGFCERPVPGNPPPDF